MFVAILIAVIAIQVQTVRVSQSLPPVKFTLGDLTAAKMKLASLPPAKLLSERIFEIQELIEDYKSRGAEPASTNEKLDRVIAQLNSIKMGEQETTIMPILDVYSGNFDRSLLVLFNEGKVFIGNLKERSLYDLRDNQGEGFYTIGDFGVNMTYKPYVGGFPPIWMVNISPIRENGREVEKLPNILKNTTAVPIYIINPKEGNIDNYIKHKEAMMQQKITLNAAGIKILEEQAEDKLKLLWWLWNDRLEERYEKHKIMQNKE